MFQSVLALTLVAILTTLASSLPVLEPVEEVMVQQKVSNVEIVGGDKIDIEKTPWQVSIQLKNKHLCGGCLIGDDMVMTATHCLHKEDTRTMKVRVGSTTWNEGGQLLDVLYIIGHDDYDDDVVTNDITLIRLDKKVELSKAVQIIPMASEETSAVTGYVSGWGQESETNRTFPLHLNGVQVTLISREKCGELYSVDEILDYHICALTKEKDSCNGDSGGPLVANGELIGVVSWGKGCANPTKPGIYTSVFAFKDWILKTIAELHS